MMFWRAYLLGGLIAHKLVWEILKRRGAPEAAATPPATLPVQLVKAVKICVLVGLVMQTALPEVIPISAAPHLLRPTGLTLYTLGLFVAVLGRVQLGDSWADIETPELQRARRVVAHGIYRYIRHPIYAGDLLLLLGFELSLNSWLVLGLTALVPVVVWRALREERALADSLPEYARYCAGTKRFVPFLV